MENTATTGSEPGSATPNQQVYSTTYKHIKAAIASVLMWLSMVGGLL